MTNLKPRDSWPANERVTIEYIDTETFPEDPVAFFIGGGVWRTSRLVRKICGRCNNSGLVSVKHGSTFETDSEDEVALAYHKEPCPNCQVS